ncbi:MAG: hypothetical protein A2340_04695 [Lentisphaerae bacterium RIFOXYB12_FULL_60_10]|nr:MAG: hypothetical protein A2340_04695 [Lentisphaerae bacterium RIFOXYB12_FULL_60_10]
MQAEDHAWNLLAGLDPGDVCVRSLSTFDPSAGTYAVSVFDMPVTVAPAARTVSGTRPDSELILKRMAYFSRLSILHYLIAAQDFPLAGRLVGPADLMAGGEFYTAGSHRLPLHAVAAGYARDAKEFLMRGIRFGGKPRPHGDAAVELLPFPRLPVTIILWLENDEFTARADLLFDATCERQVPPDILWSIAMLCLGVMRPSPAG